MNNTESIDMPQMNFNVMAHLIILNVNVKTYSMLLLALIHPFFKTYTPILLETQINVGKRFSYFFLTHNIQIKL